jgi:hypothetical protein
MGSMSWTRKVTEAPEECVFVTVAVKLSVAMEYAITVVASPFKPESTHNVWPTYTCVGILETGKVCDPTAEIAAVKVVESRHASI